MAFKIIGIFKIILVVNAAVFAKNLKFGVFPDDSGEYDSNIAWLFHDTGKNGDVEKKEEFTVCQTDACKAIAKQFLSSMNKSADPCDNFYDYACGAWSEKVDLIPPYEGSWGHTELFQFIVNKRIKGILESEPHPSDILPVRQAKKMYRSCMNLEAREKRGLDPLESIIMRTGGWPMIMDPEEWYEGDVSWQDIEKNYFYINGRFTFYDIEAPWWRKLFGEDFEEEISIAPGDLPFQDELRVARRNSTEEALESYASIIEKVAREFIKHNKAAVTEEMLRKDVEALVAFDRALYKVMQETDDYEHGTVREFLEHYSGNVTDLSDGDKIDFQNLFKILFGMENIEIKESTNLYVISPTYYSNLTVLLQETPIRTVANYIHWNFVSRMLLYTTQKLGDIFHVLKEEETGAGEGKPRWMECVEKIKMDHAASYAFATKYFDKSTEKAALEMTENIRQEMESQIDKSNWLADAAKKLLKEKLRSMKVFIGFPDWYRNRTAVMNSYKGLKVGYDYFENILSYEKYTVREKLRYLKNEKEEEPWDMEPVVVNALYGPEENYINIPAADFQPPLFTPNLPDNINYGLVGCVIGHEMGHGFDDSGIQLGKDGNKTKLSNDMIELYYKRAECFLDQFNDYWGVTEPTYDDETPGYGEGSFGRKTRGENIADTTGLHSVFEAYRKLRAKKGKPDAKLPGFEEYTDDQMFFISFASSWCKVMKPEYVEKMKMRDVHSPGYLRVIGAVSNTNDFARAFQCPKGSPMNPDDKCNIWKAEESFLANEVNKSPCDRRRRSSRWALNGW
ncbi:membrane metallo-endopeptidase-like 1 [Diachasma alloeum]|uniref:membrane metallo-endopeptidase-like 1 n=1 Tax=Diachasma alloeum TaxID=454923 RepID=UPI0007381A32|nr:membrane metallo-endopeptidase-like 1 [Diachasma alloeum]